LFWGAIYFAWDFLVENQAFTAKNIINGILTGPYLQFWYLYMLAGLYLLTPIVRIIIAHADRSLIKYYVMLWFLGASVVPFIGFFTSYNLNSDVFALTGFVGYFILGTYLLGVNIRRSILWGATATGVVLTMLGTYYMALNYGGPNTYWFQEYFSPTIIFASIAFYLLLTMKKAPAHAAASVPSESSQPKLSHPKWSRLLKVISENTLPIFLFHLIVLDALQRGYLGFYLNGNTVNSIIGVPLATALTIAICLAVIIPLKKVPYLKNLIG
jgi:surface polysaccharide O-acyltransferase-like enzyme